MLKLISAYEGQTEELFAEVVRPGLALVKEASAVSPEIQKCILGLKSTPGKVYILVNALGAGEFYGCNYNSDYFEEAELNPSDKEATWGYKTFLNAGVYRNHQNKDITKSYGKVICAAYNTHMHRVELVIEIDEKKCREVGHADLWSRLQSGEKPSVSMGCFTAGTPVTLPNFTTKCIEDIAVGDTVVTHLGRPRAVTELHPREYAGTLYTVKPCGKSNPAVQATREHPWLIITADKFYTKDAKHRKIRNTSLSITDAVWKTTEELVPGDFLLCPRPRPEEASCEKPSIPMARLLGWYLAEGHTHSDDNGVEFTANWGDELTKDMRAVCVDLGLPAPTFRDRGEAVAITIYSAMLKQLCLTTCGKYTSKKILAEAVYSWPAPAKEAFIGAVISGDGYVSSGAAYISSCNVQLLTQLQWLSASVGLSSTLGVLEHGPSTVVHTHTTEHILRYRNTCNTRLAAVCNKVHAAESRGSGGKGGPYEYEDFTLTRVEEITSSPFTGTVYNFEVAEDNTYLVRNWAVHNCRVAFDVCSICGHKSATKEDYCKHVKEQLGQVLPNGQKVCVKNPKPKFFDISVVVIGADRTSYVMDKVAYAHGPTIGSAERAQEQGLVHSRDVMLSKLKAASIGKNAEIVKRIRATAAAVQSDLGGSGEIDMPDSVIDALGASGSLQRALTTCSATGIVLKPQEFQRTVLLVLGRPAEADMYSRQNACFCPCSHSDRSVDFGDPSDFVRQLLPALLPLIGERSGFGPSLTRRVVMMKTGSRKLPVRYVRDPLLDKIAAAYNGYREQLLEKISSVVANITERDVELSTAVRRELFEGTLGTTGRVIKTAAAPVQLALLGAVPLAYFYGAHTSGSGEQEKAADSFIAKHPVLAMSVLAGLARLAIKAEETGQLGNAVSKLIGR